MKGFTLHLSLFPYFLYSLSSACTTLSLSYFLPPHHSSVTPSHFLPLHSFLPLFLIYFRIILHIFTPYLPPLPSSYFSSFAHLFVFILLFFVSFLSFVLSICIISSYLRSLARFHFLLNLPTYLCVFIFPFISFIRPFFLYLFLSIFL
jgi:hypothetical protein